MKKFLPSIFICLVFACLMVLQMVVHGQKLDANRIDKNVEKHSVYESEFSRLKLTTTKGTKVSLGSLEEPIVILNFWASWCVPCVGEFPSLNKFINKYGDKVKVLGINNDTEKASKLVKKFETKHDLKFESILDQEGEIASNFHITRIPASIVFHKGKVIHFSNKEFDFYASDFRDLIEGKLGI